ncbi:unnamed protein product [Acanthocheilonema viteae]|uniref:Uncharacterized protein n=1 Tax=Acanthocheilonema viteae TaxID=6277 RepID=A0A498SD14_ACAVI|nr:unnamed protein product [Acanthocheilonema viteae]
MKTIEASIAVDLERYSEKYSDNICVHVGDSGTTAEDSVIFRKKLASFGSKTLVDRREMASENFIIFSCTNAHNEVVQEDTETKFMDSSYQTMNTEDAKGMKNISVADGSFTPYTFDEIEGMREIGNVRLENPTSLSASLQTKYSDELTEVISQRETDGIQLANHLSEIDVRIDGRSQAGQL